MLFLGGGGSADDERALWREAFPSGSTVAVLPYAQEGRERQRATVAWFASEAERLDRIRVVDGMSGTPDVDAVDVLAIPGGNTFLLLSELRRRELVRPILEFVARGGALYGGSAGAIVLGADIDIALIADANEVGLEDTRGLDLLAGADALPHFTRDQAGFARDRARHRRRSIIGIPEDAGVVIDGTRARNVGPGTVRVFSPTDETRRDPGESWGLGAS